MKPITVAVTDERGVTVAVTITTPDESIGYAAREVTTAAYEIARGGLEAVNERPPF